MVWICLSIWAVLAALGIALIIGGSEPHDISEKVKK